jgi:hypothetical protein
MEEGLYGPILREYDVPSNFHIEADNHEQETTEQGNLLHVKGLVGRIISARSIVILFNI